MSDGWDKWSMFVLKSIERIEQAMMNFDKTIDSVVNMLNDKIDRQYSDLNSKIDLVNKKIDELTDKGHKTELNVNSQKVKLGLLIAGIALIISAIVSVLVQRVL